MQFHGTVRVAFAGVIIFLTSANCAFAQSSIGLTLPASVNTVLGDPVTLPATYDTSSKIVLVHWSKVDKRDPNLRRQPVFSYYPTSESSKLKAYGDYEGRTELVGSASLKIQSTTDEDEGTFALQVSALGEGTQEGFVELKILRSPSVTVGPSNPYVISVGRAVSLTCFVRNAKPNITALRWTKDGAEIDSARFETKYSGGNLQSPNLVIRHITRSDAGVYTCTADHVVRPGSASLTLNVHYPARIVSMSESQQVAVADHVTLQCIAEGNPPPNITWARNGRRLRSMTRSVSRDVRECSMVFENVGVNATGTYVCTADNNVDKSDVKSVMLTVDDSSPDVGSTVAILVGAIAGGLWLLVCMGLTFYFLRRRRQRAEKKRFSFYCKMGRTSHGPLGDTVQQDMLDIGRHPDLQLPEKSTMPSAPMSGIETLRRSKKLRERRYARAIYPYSTQEDNELNLEIHDVIEVLEGEDGGWCLGYLSGRIGLFPSNYVRFITAKEAAAAKHVRDKLETMDSTNLPTKGSI
ncbi:nectin-4-like [Branchiostoma floridae x Branchiostoma japonicum]